MMRAASVLILLTALSPLLAQAQSGSRQWAAPNPAGMPMRAAGATVVPTTQTVYSDAPGTTVAYNVLAAAPATLLSRAVTVTAGDTIELEVWYLNQNTTGVLRSFETSCKIGALNGKLQMTAASSALPNAMRGHFVCSIAVTSTSVTTMRVWGMQSANAVIGTQASPGATTWPRENIMESASDFTGAQTISWTAYSDSVNATQQVVIEGYTLKVRNQNLACQAAVVNATLFNAAADYLTTADGTVLTTPNIQSTTMWFNPTTANDAILYETDTNGAGMIIYYNNGIMTITDTFGFGALITGPALTPNKWYFVGLTRNGTAISLFVGDETTAVTEYTGTDVALGTTNWQERYGMGTIGDVGDTRLSSARLWNSTLTSAQIEAERLYAAPVLATNLVGDWRFGNTTSTATMGDDLSGLTNDLTGSGTGTWTYYNPGPILDSCP